MPDVAGIAVPPFLYGTAWKEEATQELVEAALTAGFRGFDTANQRKHYFEEGMGKALAAAGVDRSELFLQTKFTFQAGQDERLPYDPAAPTATQVAQSFASSLAHLGVQTLDSYVLHGPSQRPGLGDMDREAWGAMEAVHADGGTRLLGVSNVSLAQLEALCDLATVQPHFVQNRCYARLGWDASVRAFCNERGIVYQGFSLLTANRHVLLHPAVYAIARRHDCTPAQVVFRFAIDIGMLPLTGTTDAEHMATDLAVLDFALEPDEVQTVLGLAE